MERKIGRDFVRMVQAGLYEIYDSHLFPTIFAPVPQKDCYFFVKSCSNFVSELSDIDFFILNCGSYRHSAPSVADPLKTALYVLAFLVFILPISGLSGQPVNFPKPEIIAAKQGLPQGFVPGIVQDSRGLIWIATRNGLCRYDGQHIKVFRTGNGHQTSLSSLGLESIKLAGEQKIWVLSDQGDIDLFDPISETVVNYSKKPFFKKAFGNRYVKAFYTDRQNRLWLVFDKPGFACIDVKTSAVRWYHDREDRADSLNTIKVRGLIQRKNGSKLAK